jgi:hypothetical protein
MRSQCIPSARICARCGRNFIAARTDNPGQRLCSLACRYATVPLEERFWSKVRKTESCWLWTGAGGGHYGRLVRGGRLDLSHRVSWELHNGPIPDGLFVLHNCPGGDTPACVNPDHLWLGTGAENSADMVAKGRSARGGHTGRRLRGADNHRARLTEEQVREIRRLHATGEYAFAHLGRQFGIDDTYVARIVRHVAWKHVI